MIVGWLYWPTGRKQLAHFSDDGRVTLCRMRIGGEPAAAYREGDTVRSFETDAALVICPSCAAEMAR